MAQGIHSLNWHRQPGAFVWIRDPAVSSTESRVERYLVERNEAATLHPKSPKLPVLGEGTTYDVTRETGLFWVLALTSPTPDGILKFTDSWGRLGVEGTVPVVQRQRPGPNLVSFEAPAERLSMWQEEIRRLREVLEVARQMHLLPPPEVGRWKALHISSYPAETRAEMMRHVINQRVQGVSSQLVRDTKGGHHVSFVAHTLREAIWLQVAEAIGGGKAFRSCPHCLAPFEVGGGWGAPNSKRTDSSYCSARCRTAAWIARASVTGDVAPRRSPTDSERSRPLRAAPRKLGGNDQKRR